MRLSRFDLTILGAAAVLIAALAASLALLRIPDQPLRIAYLAPADSGPQNIWAMIPGDPASATQLTFTEGGIFDYAPSHDGRKIAYAERDFQTNRVDLKLLDLYTGSVTPLAECGAANADCTTPAWRADGSMIAYMRRSYDDLLGGGVPKIWIIDGVNSGTPRDYPLFNDNQTTGSQPVWSADGRRLAFYEDSGRGVLVFDFNPPDESQRIKFIPADNGMTGALSPSGELLITSTLVMAGEQSIRMQLIIADLLGNNSRDLFPDGESNDGVAASWHPDGQQVAILRQYTDQTRATRGQQVYLFDVASESLAPLIVDDAFNNGSLSFSPDGEYLLVQRFQFGAFQPGIWVYALESGQLSEAVPNAFLPAWIPKPE